MIELNFSQGKNMMKIYIQIFFKKSDFLIIIKFLFLKNIKRFKWNINSDEGKGGNMALLSVFN